ncbi:aspartate/glutamate racemase family protein [Dongia soli]|uniref:Aspartate/glutamate racemase family protein n=1 Tax=Dongia soli TaxID=600628 RepID=A0ABU5EB80_9PROT|nr:aspartate/glutamate racemase family protein [Dongia soli]MDY0883309.1 aspartate/glutamate racemase family protein [Dongia soli]
MSPSRIMLVHALTESVAPIHRAFTAHWPEATCFDLMDNSLSSDLAAAGELTQSIRERFLTLGRYAANLSGDGGKTAGILFTCSAFQPAIDAVKADLSLPVLRPNEAAFEAALDTGRCIGLLVTFPPSLTALTTELRGMAAARGIEINLMARNVDGALAALKAGDGARHDALVAEAAAEMHVDVLVLGQFSLARAAAAIAPVAGRTVLTTPDSAVRKMRQLVAAQRPS